MNASTKLGMIVRFYHGVVFMVCVMYIVAALA